MKRALFLATALAVLGTPALANESYPEYKVKSNDEGRMVIGVYEQDKDKTLFQALDENGNGQITFPEFQENTQLSNEYEVFAMFDVNQDKIITESELSKGSKTGGDHVNNNEGRFTRYSTNLKTKTGANASVAPNGFYVSAEPDNSAFGRMDDNRNGYISRTEFYKNTQHNDKASVFSSLDNNNDGVLSQSEVVASNNNTGKTRKHY